MSDMRDDLDKILYTEEQLKKRVEELGAEISRDYEGKFPVFVGILKGSCIFMADLVREVTIPCTMDFMAVSSYVNGTETTGQVTIIKDLSQSIEGRHVVIVEDILDTGTTLNYLVGYLKNRAPASVKICTLLSKTERRECKVEAAYTGFEFPDGFVVGYGLDYAEKYRNLPYIGILSERIYGGK